MVPRERKEKPRRGSVRNFLEPQDFSSIELRPSPVDSDETIRDEFEKSEDSGDLDIPVTEDSYQVNIISQTTHTLIISIINRLTKKNVSEKIIIIFK